MTATGGPLWADVPAGEPAPRPKKKDSLWDHPDFWLTSGVLAGVLLLGAVAIYLVDRWRKKGLEEDRLAAAEELTTFREMFERGELTEAEYAQVRGRVDGRVKKGVAAQPPPPPGPTPPANPPPAG